MLGGFGSRAVEKDKYLRLESRVLANAIQAVYFYSVMDGSRYKRCQRQPQIVLHTNSDFPMSFRT